MCIRCLIASSCLYNLFRINEELKLSLILQTIKTLGVPSNKLAENIPFLRLKVEGKKVEGYSFSLKTLQPSTSNGPDPDHAGVGN